MTDELDGVARALLVGCREADALPGAVQARVWARVERDVAGPHVLRPRWKVGGVAALALAAGLAALWFGSDALRARPQLAHGAASYEGGGVPIATTLEVAPAPESSPRPEAASPSAAASAGPPVAELPDPREALAPAVQPGAAHAPVRRRMPGAAPAEPVASEPEFSAGGQLKDEIARVREAQSVLAKQPKQTLAVLDALDRDHPRGVFMQERAALRVFALCASGDADRARAQAVSFIAKHATSPWVARVRASCVEDGEAKTSTP